MRSFRFWDGNSDFEGSFGGRQSDWEVIKTWESDLDLWGHSGLGIFRFRESDLGGHSDGSFRFRGHSDLGVIQL